MSNKMLKKDYIFKFNSLCPLLSHDGHFPATVTDNLCLRLDNDIIPDHRRSGRGTRGTKLERILVMDKG